MGASIIYIKWYKKLFCALYIRLKYIFVFENENMGEKKCKSATSEFAMFCNHCSWYIDNGWVRYTTRYSSSQYWVFRTTL